MVASRHILSTLFLAATISASLQPGQFIPSAQPISKDQTEYCKTDQCAQVLLKHLALSAAFCEKFQASIQQSKNPLDSGHAESSLPTPNHPFYVSSCFEGEDYNSSVSEACTCVPRQWRQRYKGFTRRPPRSGKPREPRELSS